MEIPIRCFCCGKVTGDKWESYVLKLKAGVEETRALDELGLERPCCRTTILTHLDLTDKLLRLKAMEREQVMGVQMTGGEDGYESMDES
jgi:DNA-directed RNA polymerase I, II, and III subunit RPABC5